MAKLIAAVALALFLALIAESTARSVVRCTRKGCSSRLQKGCKIVSFVYPNGRACKPRCPVCRDNDLKTLGCPNGVFMIAPRKGPQCQSLAKCQPGYLCCQWGRGRECRKGIVKAPRPGSCPSQPRRHPLRRIPCIGDFAGCRYDASCKAGQKCCSTPCKYKQCKNVKKCTKKGCSGRVRRGCRVIATYRPNGAGCSPACRVCKDRDLKRLGCPNNFFMIRPRQGRQCKSSRSCSPGKLCCRWGSGRECRPGLVRKPKKGTCPRIRKGPCLADYGGCEFDSRCRGAKKCCFNTFCKYRQCVDPKTSTKPKYTCPQVVRLCKTKWCKKTCRKMKAKYCKRD